MEIRLVIKPKSQDVPLDFLCVFLNKTLDMPLEECKEIFREKGSITFFVKDEETLERIQTFGKKYEHLISIEVERVLNESNIFKFIKDFTLNNLPFVVVWCSILLILAGITYELRKEALGSFLVSVFFLSSAIGFLEITEKEERGESYKLDLFFPITNYFFTAFGLIVGQFFVGFLVGFVGSFIYVIATSLEALSFLQIFIVLFFGFLVVAFFLWYSYVFPIVIANAYGENSFFKGFKAAFSIFNERSFRFSFTKKYFRLGMQWAFVFTIIFPLLVAVAYTGIGVPITLIGTFWLAFFLGVLAYFVRKELKNL